jgi:hypothetical protein
MRGWDIPQSIDQDIGIEDSLAHGFVSFGFGNWPAFMAR